MTMVNDKRQHNLRLPVSRITNENLSKIFRNLRNSHIEVPARCNSRGLKDWITVTHVCHAWREVALNTSLLWCHIDFLPRHPKAQDLVHTWIPELLRRSKQSPLTLIIESPKVLKHVKMHFGRVRELVLNLFMEGIHEGSLSKFQNVEVLEISDHRDSKGPFILNDSHLHVDYIRRLTLRSCSIDWNSKLLQGLTHLRLAYIPKRCRLGCSDFLVVLSKIPALETLHLTKFLAEDKKFKATKVHLLRLQQLYLEFSVPEMAQFLPCLVVPRSCKLDFRTGNEYDEICDKFRAILSWVSNQLRVPTTSLPTSNAVEQYIRSFHLLHNADVVDFTVEGFSDVLSHEQIETADPILKFVVHWTYEDDDFSFNLQTFLSLLPLDGLAFLDVVTDFNVYLSPELWTVAFGSIQTLKEVYLNTNTSNFWEALAPTNGDNSAVQSVPFSALSSITLDDYVVKYQLILAKLRARSELGGSRFQDLLLRNCRILPEPIMKQLGELVTHVQAVECHENGSSDEDYSSS